MAPVPSDEELWESDQAFAAAFDEDSRRLVGKVAGVWAPLIIVLICCSSMSGALVGAASLPSKACTGRRAILLFVTIMAASSLFILVDFLHTIGKFDSAGLDFLVTAISAEIFSRKEDFDAGVATKLLFGKIWRLPFRNPTNKEFYLKDCELDVLVKGKGMNGVRGSWFSAGKQMLVKANLDHPLRVSPGQANKTLDIKLGATLPGYMTFLSSSVSKVSRILDIIVRVRDCEGTLADKTFLFETEFILPLKVEKMPHLLGYECSPECRRDCYCSLKPALLGGMQEYQTKLSDWTVLQYDQLEIQGSMLSVPRGIVGVFALCACWLVAMGSAKLSKCVVSKLFSHGQEQCSDRDMAFGGGASVAGPLTLPQARTSRHSQWIATEDVMHYAPHVCTNRSAAHEYNRRPMLQMMEASSRHTDGTRPLRDQEAARMSQATRHSTWSPELEAAQFSSEAFAPARRSLPAAAWPVPPGSPAHVRGSHCRSIVAISSSSGGSRTSADSSPQLRYSRQPSEFFSYEMDASNQSRPRGFHRSSTTPLTYDFSNIEMSASSQWRR